jgi:hypothetical protein
MVPFVIEKTVRTIAAVQIPLNVNVIVRLPGTTVPHVHYTKDISDSKVVPFFPTAAGALRSIPNPAPAEAYIQSLLKALHCPELVAFTMSSLTPYAPERRRFS